MKKFFALLVCSCTLLFAVSGCNWGINPDDGGNTGYISEDESLAGDVVTVGESESPFYKLFVVNEGSFGGNNASLDFLRFKDGKYVNGAFAKMNPAVVGGLGDTANDVKVFLNSLWIVLNGSGIVQVLNPFNEKVLSEATSSYSGSVAIPSPRQIAFDYPNNCVYVTSYDGATFEYTQDGVTGTDKKGSLYKVSLDNLAVLEKVEVGYQPEGVTVAGDNIYVANSGGYHYSLTGQYDNTVTVVNRSLFRKIAEIEVADNLKDVCTDGTNYVWVSSQGDFYSRHSSIHRIDVAKNELSTSLPEAVSQVRCSSWTSLGTVSNGYKIYIIGTDDEFNWEPDFVKSYSLYEVDMASGNVKKVPFAGTDAASLKTPYGLCVNPYNGHLYICDAADFVSPGTVTAFDADLKKVWTHTAGIVCGHPILFAPVTVY